MMKRLMMTSLVAAQIFAAAQPAEAADLGDAKGAAVQRHGAFAGARLRVPLGGGAERKARAGLTVAPLVQNQYGNGSVRTRFGEGMELGIGSDRTPRLSFAGRPLGNPMLMPGRNGPKGERANLSTIGWVGIGVGVAAIAIFTLFQLCADGEVCGSDRDG